MKVLSLLRERNAVLFVGVSLVSGFGGSAMSIAASVWVMQLTGSSSLAALAQFCVYAPTLLGPAIGVLVDRLPRRPLLCWTNLALAGALLSLLTVRSAGQLWLVFAVMLSYGATVVLLDAGESALLPAAIAPASLGDVNGLRMSAQEGTKLLGPLAGAGLFAWKGGHSVALLTAASMAVAAGLYAMVRVGRDPVRRESGRLIAEMREGARFLWSDLELRALTVDGAVCIAMSGLTNAALYDVVTRDLHRPAAFVGVIASAQGAGSIVGGVAVGAFIRRHGEVAVGALGAAVFALGTLGRCVPWWPVVVLSGFVIGIGLPWTLIAAITAVQRRTPEGLLGRVAATASSLLFAPITAAIPLGAALVLLDHRLPLVIGAAVALAAGALPLAEWRRRRRGDDARATSPARYVDTADSRPSEAM